MSPTTKYGLIVLSLATVFAFGRFSAPEKVKTVKEIVEVEKKTTDTQTDAEKNKHKKTTVVEVTHPDGTKEKTTTVTEDTDTKKKTDSKEQTDIAKTETDTKEVTRGGGRVVISALGSLNVTNLIAPPVFGGSITKEILGPINAGVFGLSNGTAGVSLGLTF